MSNFVWLKKPLHSWYFSQILNVTRLHWQCLPATWWCCRTMKQTRNALLVSWIIINVPLSANTWDFLWADFTRVSKAKRIRRCYLKIKSVERKEKVGTLSDFQLSASVSQSREEVKLDPSLSAQVVLQMLSFLLHGWQSGQQHFCLFFHTAVLPQSLSPNDKREIWIRSLGHVQV